MNPLRLRVAEVIRETDDAVSLVFDVPPDFAYRPGQFLTLRVPTSDKPAAGGPAAEDTVARCYSLSSSPETGDRPTITVKRAGYASSWIVDNAAEGTEFEALPPAGTFTPPSLDADLLLFAGGSGITPVMSIVKSALSRGRGRVVLIYANRDERSVIFSQALRELARDPRLLVVHWLDSVQGHPAAAGLSALARPYQDYETFVCGPDPFMRVVRESLRRLGVPSSRVHVEKFLSLSENPFEARPAAPPEQASTGQAASGSAAEEGPGVILEVTMDGQKRTLPWPAGSRMLDVLIEGGLDAPFSCREGACGACACQVTAGKVKMAANLALDEEDLAEGYVLACQSLPLSESVSIAY